KKLRHRLYRSHRDPVSKVIYAKLIPCRISRHGRSIARHARIGLHRDVLPPAAPIESILERISAAVIQVARPVDGRASDSSSLTIDLGSAGALGGIRAREAASGTAQARNGFLHGC